MLHPKLFNDKGLIVSGRISQKWFKENLFEEYLKIENNIKMLFPKNYIPKSYSEYVYVLYMGKENNHMCNNPECDKVAVYLRLSDGYLDYCSKSCKSAHTKSKKVSALLNQNKGREIEILENVTSNYVIPIRSDLDIVFYTQNGRLDSNKFKEEWLKKYKSEMYNDILNNNDEDISFKEKLYLYLTNLNKVPSCKICGKRLFYKGTINKGYGKYCDNICSSKDKDAFEKGMLKHKETLKEKYGETITSYFQTDEFKIKSKETSLKKYNTEFPAQSIDVKNKINDSVVKKYGSKQELGKIIYKKGLISVSNKYGYNITNYSEIPGVKEKQKETSRRKTFEQYLKNLNIDNIQFNDTFEDFLKFGPLGEYNFTCLKCKFNFKSNFYYNYFVSCLNCNKQFKSQGEIQISKYIESLYENSGGVNIISNTKKILEGKEIDIFLPNHKLAIEYNGLMFHSIGSDNFFNKSNIEFESELKYYHINKTDLAQSKGVQLLHIFENEWKKERTRDIWKSIIKNKLGISEKVFARKTTIKVISDTDSKAFLEKNHLQGNVNSSIKLGLIDNSSGELVSVMTFGRSRYKGNKFNQDWEILRYSNKMGYSIIGGASKLFKYFLNNYVTTGEKVKTFADLRFSNGLVYKNLGFSLINKSSPNYFYFKSTSYNLENRLSYQKHKLKDKLQNFDSNLSESMNMYNNGYRKIYDCGSLVFEYSHI